MRRLAGLPTPGAFSKPTAVTVGVFDGMHLGHRALLSRTGARAAEVGGELVAVTFTTHPELVLRGAAPPPLMTLEERLRLLAAAGADACVLVEFTPQVRDLDAETFARDVLAAGLSCRHLVLGHDSAICRGREGTVERFAELGKGFGFGAERIDPVIVDGMKVSSSTIRGALVRGDVALAARLLGRPHVLAGRVVHGDGRGRTLGFPTANLEVPPLCLPAHGVYACRLRWRGGEHAAVVNLGVRPTFGGSRPVVEAHVLDFTGDLYGADVELAFVERLRAEQRFDSVDALRQQIAADVAAARTRLAAPPAGAAGRLDPRIRAT
jgi:riboflavin kinase/FMN adenylyltransferase